jgi:hypothetical protein
MQMLQQRKAQDGTYMFNDSVGHCFKRNGYILCKCFSAVNCMAQNSGELDFLQQVKLFQT